MIKHATLEDLDYLVYADIATDREDTDDLSAFLPEEASAHREKIEEFILEKGKGALVYYSDKLQKGMILYRYRQYQDAVQTSIAIQEIDRSIFPADGRYCEVYQLWVETAYRRQGIATTLKQAIETSARQEKIKLIYTHTKASNTHVIHMNEELGYYQVRCGKIWDDVLRVSLVKAL